VQAILKKYANWLFQTRKLKPHTVHNHLETLVNFWSWSSEHHVYRPEEVSPELITTYVQLLYRQWQCSTCKKRNFVHGKFVEESICTNCGANNSSPQIKNYAQNSVRIYRAVLKIFFSWAKMNRMTVTMPVKVTTPAPVPKITHYPIPTFERLFPYIWDPKADPRGALTLYLILAHGCSPWELRHLQLPQVTPINLSTRRVRLSESYRLILPARQPSLGNKSPGRPQGWIEFHTSLSSRLKPLLDRYEDQRAAVLLNLSNPYLLVSEYTCRRVHPVSNYFLWNLIQITTKEALGFSCNANTLRKTFAVILTDEGDGALLLRFGWHSCQASQYTFMNRVVLSPS
jgi:site-specific recombinase XerD